MSALFFNIVTGSVETLLSISERTYNLKISGILISQLADDGFEHVLDVDERASDFSKWKFKNINPNVLYSDHTSWVYVITVDNIIAKIGETGNMLGHRNNKFQLHPSPSTKGRISRYISGDGTDEDIRRKLHYFIKAGHTVSFWAKKCKTITDTETIMGTTVLTESATHKSQEILYLDKFKQVVGSYPYLNKSRK